MKSVLAGIRYTQVPEASASLAVRRFADEVAQADPALVLFFCAPDLDPEAVAAAMRLHFPAVPVQGCWSSGILGPLGYGSTGLAGVSFSRRQFGATTLVFEDLQAQDLRNARATVLQALGRLPQGEGWHHFAFLMVDGLAEREEQVARTLQAALGDVPLVGGSLGRLPQGPATTLYAEGRLWDRGALVTLVATRLPVRPVMAQHFRPQARRLVVTAADAERRLVFEIDGLPAAQVYAQALGLEVSALDEAVFAATPLAVLIGGTSFARSVCCVLPDGALKFYCAVEEGMVLRLMKPGDLAGHLQDHLAALRADIGPPALLLACECFLRRTEAEQAGTAVQVDQLLRDHGAMGYLSCGEQFQGIHLNQTFCGLALGRYEDAPR